MNRRREIRRAPTDTARPWLRGDRLDQALRDWAGVGPRPPVDPPSKDRRSGRAVLVRLELTPEMHHQFRVESAKEGLAMAHMAKRLVAEWLSKRSTGK